MKKNITWILVADGARAHIYKNEGPGKGLHHAVGQEFTGDHAPTHELQTDRQGRAFDSTGNARHAMEPHQDPHRLLKDKFARQMADVLSGYHKKGEFGRLILVAPAKAMGDLRAHLDTHVASCVVGELIKDLTHVKMQDLTTHLEDLIAL